MNAKFDNSYVAPHTSISFRNMDRSPALTERIEHEVQKLLRHVPDLSHCDVVVEALHRHHRHGHPYQVHLILRVPGMELAVSHEPSTRRIVEASPEPEHPARTDEVEAAHRDAYVSVRDAFDAARRRLEGAVRRARDLRRAADAKPSPRRAMTELVDMSAV